MEFSVLANIGVPMIFVQMPLMVAAAIPIIVIEAYLFARIIKINIRETIKASVLANGVSTLIGYPIAWGFMLGLEIVSTGVKSTDITTPVGKLASVIIGAAWLTPNENELYWMIPTSAIILLIPSFFLSVIIEKHIYSLVLLNIKQKIIYKVTLKINIISYVLFSISGIAWLLVELAKNKNIA